MFSASETGLILSHRWQVIQVRLTHSITRLIVVSLPSPTVGRLWYNRMAVGHYYIEWNVVLIDYVTEVVVMYVYG